MWLSIKKPENTQVSLVIQIKNSPYFVKKSCIEKIKLEKKNERGFKRKL